jgi:hypothetical protein
LSTTSKNKISENAVYLIAGILVCSGVFYFMFWFPGNDSPSADGGLARSEDVDILQEREKWSERIGKIGPENAYAEFKKEFSPMRYDQQHTIAHLFGTLLYEHEDAEGIKVCDGSYGFGCFHGFFSVILGDKGKDILPELDSACNETGPGNTGCQHGLGHGLIEYYGHSLDGLAKALEGCDRTTIFVNKFGCTSGAFMEFNIPVLLSVKNIDIADREFDPKDPYFPCTKVETRFRESCYFELGQWWEQVFNKDYTAIGKLCPNIKDETNRESCYLGIGHVLVPTHNYDIEDSVAACGKMPNEEGKMLCLAGATWQIFANPLTRSHTKHICETLPKNLVEKCLDKADLMGTHGQTFTII